jgi:hypothetical protein
VALDVALDERHRPQFIGERRVQALQHDWHHPMDDVRARCGNRDGAQAVPVLVVEGGYVKPRLSGMIGKSDRMDRDVASRDGGRFELSEVERVGLECVHPPPSPDELRQPDGIEPLRCADVDDHIPPVHHLLRHPQCVVAPPPAHPQQPGLQAWTEPPDPPTECPEKMQRSPRAATLATG